MCTLFFLSFLHTALQSSTDRQGNIGAEGVELGFDGAELWTWNQYHRYWKSCALFFSPGAVFVMWCTFFGRWLALSCGCFVLMSFNLERHCLAKWFSLTQALHCLFPAGHSPSWGCLPPQLLKQRHFSDHLLLLDPYPQSFDQSVDCSCYGAFYASRLHFETVLSALPWSRGSLRVSSGSISTFLCSWMMYILDDRAQNANLYDLPLTCHKYHAFVLLLRTTMGQCFEPISGNVAIV